VVSLVSERQAHGRVRVGGVGTIRKLVISDPNDRDQTFVMAYVKVGRGTVVLHPGEFAPAGEAEAHSGQPAARPAAPPAPLGARRLGRPRQHPDRAPGGRA
jgi:hypothetical protein